MTKPLQLGIVGAGNISGSHLDACQKSGAAKTLAICDIIKERAQARQTQYNIGDVYVDYHDLLARKDIEAIVVAVPNQLHHEVTIAALKAGKHVLCEKPMSFKPEWAESMVEAAKKSGTVLQIGMVSRYQSGAQYLKQQVVKGNLGDIYFARAQYLRRSGIPGWGSWFTRKDMAGGGPLIDIGVHKLDLAWYLLGCPKPVSVTGLAYAAFGPRQMGLGDWGTPEWDGYYDVEDFAAAFIRFENGAAISLEASWAGYTEPLESMHLLGTEKGAQLFTNKVLLLTQDEKHPLDSTISFSKNGGEFATPFAAQSAAFAQAVRGEAECVAPGEHGLVVTRMLNAIYESARQGAEVRLG